MIGCCFLEGCVRGVHYHPPIFVIKGGYYKFMKNSFKVYARRNLSVILIGWQIGTSRSYLPLWIRTI